MFLREAAIALMLLLCFIRLLGALGSRSVVVWHFRGDFYTKMP